MNYMILYICYTTKPTVFLVAVTVITSVVLSIRIYAYFMKKEFNFWIACIFVFVACLITLSGFTVMYFLMKSKNALSAKRLLVSAAFGVVYGVYLIYDTDLIIEKNHNKLKNTDYILGVL